MQSLVGMRAECDAGVASESPSHYLGTWSFKSDQLPRDPRICPPHRLCPDLLPPCLLAQVASEEGVQVVVPIP